MPARVNLTSSELLRGKVGHNNLQFPVHVMAQCGGHFLTTDSSYLEEDGIDLRQLKV